MRLFQRHQIHFAHAFARAGYSAVCVLDPVEPRAKLFDRDYDRLMKTLGTTVNWSKIVPGSTGDLQFVELTGACCAALINRAYMEETHPQRHAAKLARWRARHEKWERAQGQAMLGAT